MWLYHVTSGDLWDPKGRKVTTGYSGFGLDKNRPTSEDRPNCGPIPEGLWTFGAPFDSPDHGPYCLRLTPDPTTDTYGRDGFLSHGDSITHPGAASHGCCIFVRMIRELIWTSGDHRLLVVA